MRPHHESGEPTGGRTQSRVAASPPGKPVTVTRIKLVGWLHEMDGERRGGHGRGRSGRSRFTLHACTSDACLRTPPRPHGTLAPDRPWCPRLVHPATISHQPRGARDPGRQTEPFLLGFRGSKSILGLAPVLATLCRRGAEAQPPTYYASRRLGVEQLVWSTCNGTAPSPARGHLCLCHHESGDLGCFCCARYYLLLPGKSTYG